MDKRLILLVIVIGIFLTLNSFSVHAQTAGNCTNYANYSSNAFPNKTWIIANTTICMQVNVDNITNITIKNGGSLFLQLVNVSFVGNTTDTLGIAVENGGTLKIDNGSRIFSANGSALGFSFYYYGGSSGFINNSSISALQNFTGSNGININTTNFMLTNTTINNSLGYALNISAGSPTIQNSTLFNNPGGIIIWNSSPTILNTTINLTTNVVTDAGLNITRSNNASLTNVTVFGYTFGIVTTNSNLSLYNITLSNSTYGVFPKSSSILTFFTPFIYNFSSNVSGDSNVFSDISAFYFNSSSNGSNITLVAPVWAATTNITNTTMYGNTTANISEVWYVDINVTGRSNNTYVQGATIFINSTTNSTISYTLTTNASGTIPRINLTSILVYKNLTSNITVISNYSNYWFNASKGNSSGFNISVNITNNFIFPTSGLNLTLNLSTITINTKGSGASAGYTAQNALISLTNSSFNFTGNTSDGGVATIDVPFGVYTINISSGNYTQLGNTTYTVNVSVGGNTSYALNVTLLSRINLTSNASGRFWNSGVGTESTTGTTRNATSGTAVAVAGYATYAYNGGVVNGTFYMSSSAASYLHATSFNNTTLGGSFARTFTPSETSTNQNRSTTFWVNDSHGSNGTATDWLLVHVAPSANASTSAGVGGGGGGGGAVDYSLVITEYDRKITMAQGESKTVKVTVQNNGLKVLDKVGLTLSSINSDWYSINISKTGIAVEDLTPGEVVTYDVRLTIPSSASPKTYAGTWRAKDKSALSIAEKAFNLTVTEVWSEQKISELNATITSTEKLFADLEKNITALKDTLANYSTVEASLNSTKELLKKARAAYDTGDYQGAENTIAEVEAEIVKIVNSIQAIQPPSDIGTELQKALSKPTGIALLIGVIAAAGLGGFFLWWQFFRMVSIAEIKKNPAKFLAGARVEGVIKSITDTKKGKVFLVSDTSGEKLHVRYPYYTTAEVGDLIRVSGVVKTYKEIPYMDATELARLSIKPTAT